MKIASVAVNSQVKVDHARAMVSNTEASMTTSYRRRSATGSCAASKAPTPLTATRAAPRLRSQAMLSVVAAQRDEEEDQHTSLRNEDGCEKMSPMAMLDHPHGDQFWHQQGSARCVYPSCISITPQMRLRWTHLRRSRRVSRAVIIQLSNDAQGEGNSRASKDNTTPRMTGSLNP